MKTISGNPEDFQPVKTAQQHIHEGIKARAYRECKVCGRRFYSGFQRLTCYNCMQKALKARHAERPNKLDDAATEAILAVERRKAEIKAEQRKRRNK